MRWLYVIYVLQNVINLMYINTFVKNPSGSFAVQGVTISKMRKVLYKIIFMEESKLSQQIYNYLCLSRPGICFRNPSIEIAAPRTRKSG
jgi:hypothetical protein